MAVRRTRTKVVDRAPGRLSWRLAAAASLAQQLAQHGAQPPWPERLVQQRNVAVGQAPTPGIGAIRGDHHRRQARQLPVAAQLGDQLVAGLARIQVQVDQQRIGRGRSSISTSSRSWATSHCIPHCSSSACMPTRILLSLSTTSRRRPCSGPLGSTASACRSNSACGSHTGTCTAKQEPRPGSTSR